MAHFGKGLCPTTDLQQPEEEEEEEAFLTGERFAGNPANREIG